MIRISSPSIPAFRETILESLAKGDQTFLRAIKRLSRMGATISTLKPGISWEEGAEHMRTCAEDQCSHIFSYSKDPRRFTYHVFQEDQGSWFFWSEDKTGARGISGGIVRHAKGWSIHT